MYYHCDAEQRWGTCKMHVVGEDASWPLHWISTVRGLLDNSSTEHDVVLYNIWAF